MLNELTGAGSLEVLGVKGTSAFTFNKKSGVVALAGSIDNLDIERMLASMGINVNLGILNLQLKKVAVSYANFPVPELNIQAGMYFEADVAFLGMAARTKYKLGLDGLELSVMFDISQLSRVFKEEILGRLRSVFKAAFDAGMLLKQGAEEAQKAFTTAESAVNAAMKEVVDVYAMVEKEIARFASKAASKMSELVDKEKIYEAAKTAADTAVTAAQEALILADEAYQFVVSNALEGVVTASSTLSKAKSAFDEGIAPLQSVLDGARSWRDDLAARRDQLDTECNNAGFSTDCGILDFYNCLPDEVPDVPACTELAGTAAIWAAATANLELADVAVNDFLKGGVSRAYTAAQKGLGLAESALRLARTGEEYLNKIAREEALEKAKEAAKYVLTGAEYWDIQTTRWKLQTANGLGEFWAAAGPKLLDVKLKAYDKAWGEYSIAKLALQGASATFDAARDAFNKALDALQLEDFLRLNSLAVDVVAKLGDFRIKFRYDLVVVGLSFKGEFGLEGSDPWSAITNKFFDIAKSAVKTAYKDLDKLF